MVYKRKTFLSILLVVCLGLTFMLAGCSKVNKENYEKLKIGMDYEEVVKIIGNPDDCTSEMGIKTCLWQETSKQVKIRFVADKVVWLSSEGL